MNACPCGVWANAVSITMSFGWFILMLSRAEARWPAVNHSTRPESGDPARMDAVCVASATTTVISEGTGQAELQLRCRRLRAYSLGLQLLTGSANQISVTVRTK